MGVMDLPVKLGTVLASSRSVFCSYAPFHSVLDRVVSEGSAVLLFEQHNMSKDSVAAEVLELFWEGKEHSLLLADIHSLGVFNGG